MSVSACFFLYSSSYLTLASSDSSTFLVKVWANSRSSALPFFSAASCASRLVSLVLSRTLDPHMLKKLRLLGVLSEHLMYNLSHRDRLLSIFSRLRDLLFHLSLAMQATNKHGYEVMRQLCHKTHKDKLGRTADSDVHKYNGIWYIQMQFKLLLPYHKTASDGCTMLSQLIR